MTTHDDRHSSRVGRVLCDRWSIEDVVVRSPTGCTYAAREPDGTRRILKLLDPELAARGLAGEFASDVEAIARLDLDELPVSIDRDVEPFESTALAVFEPVVGTKLASAAPLDVRALVDVAEQLLELLVKAHWGSVVDRDLSPENLVRDESGVVRLIDPTAARLGPVVADEAPSESNDLYELGLALYRLATGIDAATLPRGSRPFRALYLAAPSLHPDVAAFVDRALEADPDARWRSADEMLDALRKIRATVAPKPSRPPRSAPPGTTTKPTAPLEPASEPSPSRAGAVLVAPIVTIATIAREPGEGEASASACDPRRAPIVLPHLDTLPGIDREASPAAERGIEAELGMSEPTSSDPRERDSVLSFATAAALMGTGAAASAPVERPTLSRPPEIAFETPASTEAPVATPAPAAIETPTPEPAPTSTPDSLTPRPDASRFCSATPTPPSTTPTPTSITIALAAVRPSAGDRADARSDAGSDARSDVRSDVTTPSVSSSGGRFVLPPELAAHLGSLVDWYVSSLKSAPASLFPRVSDAAHAADRASAGAGGPTSSAGSPRSSLAERARGHAPLLAAVAMAVGVAGGYLFSSSAPIAGVLAIATLVRATELTPLRPSTSASIAAHAPAVVASARAVIATPAAPLASTSPPSAAAASASPTASASSSSIAEVAPSVSASPTIATPIAARPARPTAAPPRRWTPPPKVETSAPTTEDPYE